MSDLAALLVAFTLSMTIYWCMRFSNLILHEIVIASVKKSAKNFVFPGGKI